MKFKYGDKVRVKSGFYEGCEGFVEDYKLNECFDCQSAKSSKIGETQFEIQIIDKRKQEYKTIQVDENNLEKIE